jgi:hypothetical protein
MPYKPYDVEALYGKAAAERCSLPAMSIHPILQQPIHHSWRNLKLPIIVIEKGNIIKVPAIAAGKGLKPQRPKVIIFKGPHRRAGESEAMKFKLTLISSALFLLVAAHQSSAFEGVVVPIPVPVPVVPVVQPVEVVPVPFFFGGFWWWNDRGYWYRGYSERGPWGHPYRGRIPDGVVRYHHEHFRDHEHYDDHHHGDHDYDDHHGGHDRHHDEH